MLKVEYLPIGEVTPYAGNAKMHPAHQIEQIKESIKQFGFNDPLAIWRGEIVEGHGRYIAAQELGMTEIPVIRLDGLTDEERRAYALVHNKLTMNSDFDLELLDIELSGIEDIDMDTFGFWAEQASESKKESRSIDIVDSISIVIDCDNEEEAERIYEELTAEGYSCRVSTL